MVNWQCGHHRKPARGLSDHQTSAPWAVAGTETRHNWKSPHFPPVHRQKDVTGKRYVAAGLATKQ